ncbi:hypothetical protein C2S52_013322 [Perilla frutescens var. hirtella]|nr:hypothetical protein C2S52_013322 [Perilla frutescens var. hirtella]
MLRRKDLQERDNSESGEYVVPGSAADWTHCENSESKSWLDKGLKREDEEDLMDEIFRHQLNSQYNVISPNSRMWDCKLCIFQGRCSNCLVTQMITHSLQSNATTLVKPGDGDEGARLSYLQSGAGYFKCSFGQKCPEQGFMLTNLAAESYYCTKTPAIRYFDSNQITEQHNSAETSKHCGSDFLQQQPSSNSMIHSRYVAVFNYGCPRAQHHSLQTSAVGLFYAGITECKPSNEIWKQEMSEEQRLMEGYWQRSCGRKMNKFHQTDLISVVNTIETNNWNNESRSA